MSGFCGGSPPYAGGWDIRNQVKLDKAERTNKKSNKKTVCCWKEKEGRDDEGGDKGRERRKTGGRGREQEMASTRGNKARRGAVLIRWDEVAVCVCMRDE